MSYQATVNKVILLGVLVKDPGIFGNATRSIIETEHETKKGAFTQKNFIVGFDHYSTELSKLKQGSKVFIEGKLQTNKIKEKQTITEVVIHHMEVL